MLISDAEGRNTQLDGLRGYAAMSVAAFHTITMLDYSQIDRLYYQMFWDVPGIYGKLTKFVFIFLNGVTPVTVFFVLSGAVLCRSLMQSDEAYFPTAVKFMVRRTLRIYPALLVALIVGWLVMNFAVRPTPINDLFLEAALYQFTIIGATWTLNVEMLAIPVILLAFIGYRHLRGFGLFMALVAISLTFRHLIPPGPPDLLRAAWSCFAVGMLIPTGIGAFVARSLPRHSWIPALIVMVGAMHFIPQSAVMQVTTRVSAGVLVALIYYGKGGRLGWFLDRPFSRFMGKISFSFYLFSVPVMLLIGTGLTTDFPWTATHPLEAGLYLSVVVILATIPIAALSYSWVEKPGIRLGALLTGHRVRRPANMKLAPSIPVS